MKSKLIRWRNSHKRLKSKFKPTWISPIPTNGVLMRASFDKDGTLSIEMYDEESHELLGSTYVNWTNVPSLAEWLKDFALIEEISK